MAGSQTAQKNKITPKIASFLPEFNFCVPKSHKNPGVGGWVNTFGKDLPKRNVFFYTFPKLNAGGVFNKKFIVHPQITIHYIQLLGMKRHSYTGSLERRIIVTCGWEILC